jgi:hypothetical protein
MICKEYEGAKLYGVAVAEARDSSGTQRKRNVRCWKPLPKNSGEDVSLDTRVCV